MAALATVRDVMNSKVVTAEGSETVRRALELMTEKGIGSVVVTENGKPKGIFSERDIQRYLRALTFRIARPFLIPLKQKVLGIDEILNTTLKEVMSSPLKTIRVQATLSEAYQLMISSEVRHLPVMDNDKLVGILSERDLFQWMLRKNL